MKRINKSKVVSILNKISKNLNQKEISTNGLVDFSKLHKNPCVLNGANDLIRLGVNRDWLTNNGFIIADLLLGRFLEEQNNQNEK